MCSSRDNVKTVNTFLLFLSIIMWINIIMPKYDIIAIKRIMTTQPGRPPFAPLDVVVASCQ